MKFNYNKLRGRIVEKFGCLKNFSDELSITYESLSKKLNNLIAVSQTDIIEWCQLLDIPTEEIGSYFFALEVQSN